MTVAQGAPLFFFTSPHSGPFTTRFAAARMVAEGWFRHVCICTGACYHCHGQIDQCVISVSALSLSLSLSLHLSLCTSVSLRNADYFSLKVVGRSNADQYRLVCQVTCPQSSIFLTRVSLAATNPATACLPREWCKVAVALCWRALVPPLCFALGCRAHTTAAGARSRAVLA